MMTPQQMASVLGKRKRTTVEPSKPRKRRRRVRRAAPGQVMTTTDVVTQRSYTTNSRKTAALTVANTEYVSNIAGGASGSYTVLGQILLQPRSFSWLKTLAQAYSLFKFGRVRLHYKPVVGTTTNATVAIGFFSDAADGNFWYNTVGSLSTLSQARKFVQGPAWSELVLELDPDDYNTDWFYQSNTDVASDADRRLTSAGVIATYTQSNATITNTPLGNLYIEYELMMKDPVPFSSNI